MMTTFRDEFVKNTQPYPQMVDAIRCLRADGIKTALLTNNSELPGRTPYLPIHDKLFDVVSHLCPACYLSFKILVHIIGPH